MKWTYIILVNWNGWGDTLECLESIFRQESTGIRVIVCDNDSTDDSVARIQAWAGGGVDVCVPVAHPLREKSWPPVPKPIECRVYSRHEAEQGGGAESAEPLVLIKTGANLGFAGGNNVGLRYVVSRGDFDYVWLLNNDTVIDCRALREIIERMQEDSAIGMCGSTLAHYETPKKIQAMGGGYYCRWIGLPWHIGRFRNVSRPVRRERAERWMNYVVGASLCVSRSFLEQVGLMNEDYFLYFEETDWSVRGRWNFSLGYAPRSIVYHKVGRSIGTSSNPKNKSLRCDFFAIRNRLRFTRHYYPFALPTIYLSIFGAFLIRCVVGRWDLAHMVMDVFRGHEDKWEVALKPQGSGAQIETDGQV